MSEHPTPPENGQKMAPPGPAANYLLLSAGSIFTSMLIAGFIVGYFLDELFDTRPILMLACALLGFIGGMQKVIRLTQRLDRVVPENKND
ncbi:MAG: AtpZ/AtpI family protein [Thiotrichales bacterium]|nr:AtpZ/AtpI family protein [Thiotrichales bacterium]